MRKTRTWLFLFLPVLYVAIVLGFVSFQFSKKSDSFRQSAGDLTLSGKTSTGGQPAELALRDRGLEFLFDAAHVLQVESADGAVVKIHPLSWEWKDGNVIVSFQQGIQLAFEKTDGGSSLRIVPVANQALKKVVSFRIPFGTAGGARIVRSSRPNLIQVVQSQTRLLASVDGPRDRIETDSTFILRSGTKGFRPARLDPLRFVESADLTWVALDGAGDPKDAESALTKYWDRAYGAWNSAATFSTELADAWGREALARRDYPATFAKIQNLLARDRKAWGFEAVSYLGNVVELTGQHRRAVESASSRSQPDWAGQERLWLDARLYGPEGSDDRVKELLLSGRMPSDIPGLLAVFQNLRTVEALQPSDAVSDRVQAVLKALLSQVVRWEGNLYVQPQAELLDVRSSLILGRLWLDYADSLGNEAYGRVGAQLVLSALAQQDANGRLPEALVIQEGRVVRQEGTVLPEEIYSMVRPAAMSEIELPDWGSGAFVRSPGTVTAVKISSDEARFGLRFPTGSAQHVIVSGVPAFDHITMHGIRWRTDPQFQSYTDGWAYSRATKTLFIKIKHRDDLEEIIIHFQPE